MPRRTNIAAPVALTLKPGTAIAPLAETGNDMHLIRIRGSGVRALLDGGSPRLMTIL